MKFCEMARKRVFRDGGCISLLNKIDMTSRVPPLVLSFEQNKTYWPTLQPWRTANTAKSDPPPVSNIFRLWTTRKGGLEGDVAYNVHRRNQRRGNVQNPPISLTSQIVWDTAFNTLTAFIGRSPHFVWKSILEQYSGFSSEWCDWARQTLGKKIMKNRGEGVQMKFP